MALKSDTAAEESKDQLSRGFLGRSIFDFCNNIPPRAEVITALGAAVETAFTLTLQSGYPNRDATGMTIMTEAVTIDRPPAAKEAVSQRRSAKSTTVSTSALALHLDCSRTYIGKLEAEGVIQRQGDGFPLDQSRVAYLRYLRRERQSPRNEADADHVKVKTEMLQLRLLEKKRELVRMDEVNELIDGICDVVLTHLSSLPARCAPRGDLGPGATSSGSCSRCAARPPTSASRWPTSAVSRRSMNRADEFSRWECFRCSH